jgi:hypothetical protein
MWQLSGNALFFSIGNGYGEKAILKNPVLIFKRLEARRREGHGRRLGVVVGGPADQ